MYHSEDQFLPILILQLSLLPKFKWSKLGNWERYGEG